MFFAADQLESALEVDLAGRHERTVGPQRQLPVSGLPGERDTGVDQLTAQVVAAAIGVDEQDSQRWASKLVSQPNSSS